MGFGLFVTPAEDELLSSYLVRVADSLGASPYRFCSYHFPGIPIWNRDIDRSAPDSLIRLVSVAADISVTRVSEMTLRSIERVTTFGHRQGSAAWINAAGVFHNVRRRHALQFCPECLTLTPAYRRTWRLSFVTICPVHQRLLFDACPRCDAPVMPHRQMAGGRRCHACHAMLIDFASQPAVSGRVERSWLEECCLEALSRNCTMMSNSRVSALDFFVGLRALISAIGIPAWNKQKSDCEPRFESLELSRTETRARMFHLMCPVLEDWPSAFLDRARELGVTQGAFSRKRVPEWLRKVVRLLPASEKRHSVPRGQILRSRLRALHRHKPAGWRSVRADLIVNAVPRSP